MTGRKSIWFPSIVMVCLLLAGLLAGCKATPSPQPTTPAAPKTTAAPSTAPAAVPTPTPSPTPAAKPAPTAAFSYQGKTITIVVTHASASSADIWARFWAKWFGKVLPGNPTVIVRNEPAGGGITASNTFQRAKPDGLTLIMTGGGPKMSAMLNQKGVEYDYGTWQLICGNGNNLVVYGSSKVPVQAKDYPNAKGLKYGGLGPTGAMEMPNLLAYELLGLPVDKFIWGLSGTGDRLTSLLRGEIDIATESPDQYLNVLAPEEKAGNLHPMFTMGVVDSKGVMFKDPRVKTLPSLAEVYQQLNGKPPSGDLWNTFSSVIGSAQGFTKTLHAPPGTPANILDVLKQAVMKVTADPEAQKELEKLVGPVPVLIGEEAERQLKAAVNMDPKQKDWLKNYLTTRFNVKF